MADDVSISPSKGAVPRIGLPWSGVLKILAWPLLSLILIALLWYWTLSKIDADKHALEKKAREDVSQLCHDYEQYLAQVIEQANQITLQLKYTWERTHADLDLQELSQSGIYRSTGIVNVMVINREGKPVTSAISGQQNFSFADRDYFIFHQGDESDVLLIGKPVLGRLSGTSVITFSRRLSTSDGRFDGVAVASFTPSYLTGFYAGSFPGKTGFLAVAGLDGTLRSVKIGDQPDSTPVESRAVPLFDTPEGASNFSEASWAGDKMARFVAWRTLKDHPLVVMAGISEQEYFAPYQVTWTTYRRAATLASMLLFSLALVAAGMSARFVRGKFREEQVRKAYRVATEGGNEGFYMYEALHDKNGTIVDFKLVDCNERGAEFYGIDKPLLQRKLSSFYSSPYLDELMNNFRKAMESGFYEYELKVPHESKLIVEWIKVRLVRSGNGLAVTLQDISERKLTEKKIEFLAHHDPLTHLPNRVLLRDRFEQAMSIAKREEAGIAVLFLDLDHFKQINDGFGHQVGDQLLIQVVKRLQDCIRDSDTISRQGGDEFIIILTNVEDISGISRVAQNMLDTVSEPFEIGGRSFHTSASIGIALFPDDGTDFDNLLKNADTAMYQAKESGRNMYRFFAVKMNVDAMDRLNLDTQLRTALQKKQFQLHYQPQFDLVTGGVIGVEALIRWHHPEQGTITPARFIPVAEASGLIIPIGEWVLEEACRQARIWQQSGHPSLKVAVNLSALQFKRGNILETVSKALERSGLEPAMMELELTESILLQDMESALKTIHELKTLGVQLSIDDFGTGYSSLSYLKQLKVDKLKIDQSFVRHIVADVDDLAIVCAIIQLGKTLQMQVIAEGVETAEQLQTLTTHGCDEAQGYYFCRPLPAVALADWLLEKNRTTG